MEGLCWLTLTISDSNTQYQILSKSVQYFLEMEGRRNGYTGITSAFISFTMQRMLLPQLLQYGIPQGDPSPSASVSRGILSALLHSAPPDPVPSALAMQLVTSCGPTNKHST